MSDGKLSVTSTALTRITELESQVEQLQEHIQIVESDNADLRKVYAGEVRTSNTLRVLLKRLESIMGDLTDGNCRICGHDMYEGHAPDCELA